MERTLFDKVASAHRLIREKFGGNQTLKISYVVCLECKKKFEVETELELKHYPREEDY